MKISLMLYKLVTETLKIYNQEMAFFFHVFTNLSSIFVVMRKKIRLGTYESMVLFTYIMLKIL